MSLHVWLIYISACAVLLIIPGPTSWIIMRCAADQSASRLVKIVAGTVLGDAIAMSICNLGLGALLATSALALTSLKIAAAVYLVTMGLWSLLRTTPTVVATDLPKRQRVFWTVFLVTALNPKGIAFFCAFLPQFVDSGGSVLLQLLILQMTFGVLSFASTVIWFFAGAYLRAAFAHTRFARWCRHGSGLLLIGAGVAEAVAKEG